MTLQSRLRDQGLATLRSSGFAYVVVLICWLSVDVIAAVSNDGVWVLNHAYAPRESGLVEIGYRYLGYPLFARSMIEGSELVGLDPLFGIVIAQRLLVLGVGLMLVRLYRLWGAVLFAIAFAVPTLIQVDYILAESLAVSLTAFLAILFALFWFRDHRRLLLLSAMVAIVFMLGLMRRQFLVLLLVPGVALVDMWIPSLKSRQLRDAPRLATSLLVGLVAVLAVFQMLVSAENERELGDVDQAAEAYSSVEYLSAWRTVFVLEGLIPTSDYLEEVYADGSPWPSWREIRAENERVDWPDRFNEGTERLLAESGLSVTGLRVKSFFGGLVGGRFDDMSAIKQRLESDSLDTRLSSSYASGNVQRMGEGEFLARYNQGVEPSALVTSTLFPIFPSLSRHAIGVGWLVLVVLGLALLRGTRNHLFMAIAAAPHILIVAVGAWFLGDTYRWLLPTLIFSFVAAGAGLAEAHRIGKVRRPFPAEAKG